MADGRPAYDPDRLPWLTDTRRSRRKSDSTTLLVWALVATLLIAGVSYWAGMKSITDPGAFPEFGRTQPPAATVRLPEPTTVPPRVEEVLPPPVKDVEPVSEPPPVPIPRAEPVRPSKTEAARPKAKAKSAPRKARARPPAAKKRRPTGRPTQLQAWPADVSAGAYGRVARIGTFSSRAQAKRGWRQIVRHYPGMRRLKAVVAPVPSLRDGRTYYRLQFGTTSQAHSEVLCQRMRIIGQSCVVVGLPANRGVRR